MTCFMLANLFHLLQHTASSYEGYLSITHCACSDIISFKIEALWNNHI